MARHRTFTDTAGTAWMVRYSENADTSASGDHVAIRPPGLWFTSPARGEKRFLFWPTLFEGELESMPESRLQQLLERSDSPG